MPISIAVLIAMLYNFSQTVEHLSHSLIKRTISQTNLELTDFFEPVTNNLYITRDQGLSGKFKEINPENLNPHFIPFVKNSRQVSSMLVANSLGNEYMLLQEDSTWQNRVTIMKGELKNVERFRWIYDESLKGKIMERWVKPGDSSNNPLQKTWFSSAVNEINDSVPSWTAPYLFKTTKEPGITASISWKSIDSSIYSVVAFDVLLTDISKFTTQLDISPNGKALVFTEEGKVVGLPTDPRFLNVDSIKKYVLKNADSLNIAVINTALEKFKGDSTLSSKPYQFKFDDGKWWCGIEKFKLNNHNSFYIAVMVPEADFLAEVNRTRIVIISGFLLVTILTLLVIRGYNQKRKDNELLKKQKQEIEGQKVKIEKQRDEIELIHHELKSSINYAKRIQQAVLPDKENLNKILPQNFILFRPHSVVSGDFYWATKINSKIILTAADCTGHGVPGAFMSMLGVTFLNDIVKKSEVTTAGQVLDLLRENVITALKQRKVESDENQAISGMKDGMDISFCVLDKENMELQFAGANNPLYLVRETIFGELEIENQDVKSMMQPDLQSGKYSLYEIKADKMPIAIYERMNNFKTTTLKIKEGDLLYMFSDGYIDQFGGVDGKKFKSRPFKNLILSIAEMEMHEQEEILKETITNYISTISNDGEVFTQTDDMVVFGVRI